jgi:hypothetical protein
MHWVVPPIMRFITLWQNPNCAKDYLNSTCYKVIAQDPADEVIPDACSLKTGISNHIVQQEIDTMNLKRAFAG